MSILRAVLAELRKMFLADLRLSAALLAVVALAAGGRAVAAEAFAGAMLLAGCLAVLVVGVLGTARRRR